MISHFIHYNIHHRSEKGLGLSLVFNFKLFSTSTFTCVYLRHRYVYLSNLVSYRFFLCGLPCFCIWSLVVSESGFCLIGTMVHLFHQSITCHVTQGPLAITYVWIHYESLELAQTSLPVKISCNPKAVCLFGL